VDEHGRKKPIAALELLCLEHERSLRDDIERRRGLVH